MQYDDEGIPLYYTIAETLSDKGIIPPKYWMITKAEDELIFYDIKWNL